MIRRLLFVATVASLLTVNSRADATDTSSSLERLVAQNRVRVAKAAPAAEAVVAPMATPVAEVAAPAAAPAAPVTASATVEERLKFLEEALAKLQKENVALRQQKEKEKGANSKAPAAVVVVPAGTEKSLKIGGFIQGQGEFGRAADSRYAGVRDRFFLRRARLAISGAFAENFDFKLEADFGANTASEKTGLAGQFTDTFINWNRHPQANVKFGQFKSPFGYEQLVSDPKLLTIERSLANDRLTDGRQIGLGVNGGFAKDRFTYAVGVFNGTGVNTSANDNAKFLFAGRVAATAFAGKLGQQDAKLSVGLNGLATRDTALAKSGFGFDAVPGGAIDNLFTGRRQALGVDTQFRFGRFGLDAEYLRAEFHPVNRLPLAQLTADGWSALATWFVVPKSLQAIVRYETFDPNTSVATNESSTWTLGLTWLLKGDDLKLGVNYLLGDPAGSTTRQNRLLTRVQLVF